MKTFGIIGAMEEEVTYLKQKTEIISAKSIVGVEFYMGKLQGKNVVVVRSGIGKVNATVCVQVLCDIYGVDCVINTGVAGALHPDLGICDVVVSSDVVQHDFDASGFGYEPGFIPRMSVSFFPADEELSKTAVSVSGNVLPERKVLMARIASGDSFVTSPDAKEYIRKTFGAACVEMEGAAVGHTCYLNKIPFVVIRSMSDDASSDAKDDFKAYADEAAAQSCSIVENMLKEL